MVDVSDDYPCDLMLRGDGDLVLTGRDVWNSGVMNTTDAWKNAQALSLFMQNDANLVLYARRKSTTLIWASNSYDLPVADLTCMIKPDHLEYAMQIESRSISNVSFPPQGLMSENGCFVARQDPSDCSLHVYNTRTNRSLYSFDCEVEPDPLKPFVSRPWCRSPCSAALQNDGTFIVRGFWNPWHPGPGNKQGPYQGSRSFGDSQQRHPQTSFTLTLQNDGNLLLRRITREESPLWASQTSSYPNAWLFELGTEIATTMPAEHYIDLGKGKCQTTSAAAPQYEYLGGQGTECAAACSARVDCHGYSASDSRNCLLWLQQDILGGGVPWGNASCHKKVLSRDISKNFAMRASRDALYKDQEGTTEASKLFKGEALIDATGQFLLALSESCELSLIANRWMPIFRLAPTTAFKYIDCFLQYQSDSNLVLYGSYTKPDNSKGQAVLWAHPFQDDIVKVQLRSDGSFAGLTLAGEVGEEAIQKNGHCTVSISGSAETRMCYGAGKVCDPCTSSQSPGLRFAPTLKGARHLKGLGGIEMAAVEAFGLADLIPGVGEVTMVVEAAVMLGWLFWHFLGSSSSGALTAEFDEWFKHFVDYEPGAGTDQCFWDALQLISPTDAATFGTLHNVPSVVQQVWNGRLPFNSFESVPRGIGLRLRDDLTADQLLPIIWERFNYRNSMGPQTAAVCWKHFGGSYPIDIVVPDESDVEFAETVEEFVQNSPCQLRVHDYLKHLCWEQLENPPLTRTSSTSSTDTSTTTSTTTTKRSWKCLPSPSVKNRGIPAPKTMQHLPDKAVHNKSSNVSFLSIINGEEFSSRKVLPPDFLVKLHSDATKRECTGTVIGNNWILTAASCVFSDCIKHSDSVFSCILPWVVMVGLTANDVARSVITRLRVLKPFKVQKLKRWGMKESAEILFYYSKEQLTWLESQKIYREQVDPEWTRVDRRDALFDPQLWESGLDALYDVAILQVDWESSWTSRMRDFVRLDGEIADVSSEGKKLLLMGFGEQQENMPGFKGPLGSFGTSMMFRPCAASPALLALMCPGPLQEVQVRPSWTVAGGDQGGPAVCQEAKEEPWSAAEEAREGTISAKLAKLGVNDPVNINRFGMFGFYSMDYVTQDSSRVKLDLSLYVATSMYQFTICGERGCNASDDCWACWGLDWVSLGN
eukprot:TRINITY_DN41749_c0_g1_i1.p1 TRINITY_DN41749_c0_g1~~TRINITY_DN41749_c0_g1_i1.p1  ORF type:complete len:1157 (-),score=149.61 TRINITY_DN41749_c0_g1_i1:223-3693(-)